MAAKFGSTQLCASLVANTVDEMAAEMSTARSQGADVAELRIDHLTSFDPRSDLERLIKNHPIPVLVTYR